MTKANRNKRSKDRGKNRENERAMICDLNIVYPVSDFNESIEPQQLKELKKVLDLSIQLGYTHVALNFCPETTTSNSNKKRLPNDLNLINPINIDRDFSEFKDKLKIFTRITVKIDDPSQCQNIAKFQTIFDIVAVEPKTEKSFQSAISNLDIDIISFDLQDRLPCYMKHKPLGAAIDKGIYFEIKYTDLLTNSNRAQVISNIKQIIRASRNRGMILSSGVRLNKMFQLRNLVNVTPILKMLGVDSNRCSKMFKDWSLKVLLNGRLRIKSYKQTIAIADNDLIDNSLEDKNWEHSKLNNIKINNVKQNINTYKRKKTENSLDRVLKKRKS